jgi:predicted dinucleotide-binding enzyme
MPHTIAILGAGSVGGALGRRFLALGHDVRFGVSNPDGEKYMALAAETRIPVSSVGEAVRGADLVVLAVPYDAVKAALAAAGDLDGRIVVDCTNPLAFADGRLSLTRGFDTSGAEEVARLAPGARIVKCFNQTGYANMVEPVVGEVESAMFVCGDDADAREVVRALAASIGFDAIDAGRLEVARLLEPLAMLWIHLSMTTPLGRDFAFGVLRR